MKNTEKEELIFEFWNSFKGGQTSTKLCPKVGTPIRWHSHNKLTYDMRLAMGENLKNYSVEEMCMAIDNYAQILLRDDTFWTHVWPLSTFFAVKYANVKDARKKWWQFLPENFNIQTFLKKGNSKQGSFQKQEELPLDPDPELTELIIDRYKYWYRPKGRDFPNFTAQKHFILAAVKAKENYKLNSITQKKNFVDEFFQIARDVWSSKGSEVMPWDLSGTLMWDYKMPQYYQNMGIPESTIGEINGNLLPESELEVEKLPTLGAKSTRKEIGEEEDPDFDYVMGL